ncbi:TIGR02452 family protein [Lentzea jiangxiensis]|uniref:TIGR02452 family protein n=1 Tax=Lentzea jiangxiensis TaxID=641025 RepID=A0A1H0QU95_9PSEU|nr:TIGR02452 family protein [Lentzea jiangxiensis]SDP20715.1 TIGR02452 family protein [Lentzea jiangxiensis]
MSSRLRAIAHDTVEISERGSYATGAGEVAVDVSHAVSGTRLHLPDEVLSLPSETAGVRVEVTGESTLEAARRLGGDIAALNFASARKPGGGFLNGRVAQEESIARASALYLSLSTAGEFYEHHRAHTDLTYTDRVIYSPRVPVFRDDEGELLPRPYEVSFLTAAAPNLAAIRRNQPEKADGVPLALLGRAIRVLHVAASHGHRRLVLGAWGCGVFGNDPATVARIFALALRDNRYFEHVVFAVLDRHEGAPTFSAFAEVFV